MDRNKVYIGYNKDKKRCLLYKKGNTFLDLETKEKYDESEILQDSMISYNKLVKSCGYSSKRTIKKKYLKEENKKISLTDLYIGEIHQITEIVNANYTGNNLLNLGVNYDFYTRTVFSNRLLQRDQFGRFTDLITLDKFNYDIFLKEGQLYVPEERECLRPFLEEFSEYKTELPKIKVLKKYQEKYNLENSYGKD